MTGIRALETESVQAQKLARRVSLTQWTSWVLCLIALTSLAALVLVLIHESWPVWRVAGIDYLAGKQWLSSRHLFGAAPMIYGTMAVAIIALGCAAPIGIGAAICTSELLPRRARLTVKILVELLAGVPSVVYGLLGVLVLRGWVYDLLEPLDPLSGDTLLTGGLLVGVMILPTILTLSDDALRGVPASLRAAARGLGLNARETICRVVLPQAIPGIIAAILLALGRALGEMIAVFLVVGRQDNQWPERLWSVTPLISPGQTLASKLGGSEIHIAHGDPLHWAAMVGLGLLLLGMAGGAAAAAFLLQQKQLRHAQAS